MGIGTTELQFYFILKIILVNLKSLTLGRQQIGIENFEIKKLLNKDCKYKIYDYCEELLKINLVQQFIQLIFLIMRAVLFNMILVKKLT